MLRTEYTGPPLPPDIQRRMMQSPTGEAVLSPYPQLASQADDLFSGKRTGHMISHVFNAESSDAWNTFTAQVKDYGPAQEIDIITTHSSYFAEIGEKLKREGPLFTMSQGCGGEYAVRHKDVPTVLALRPDGHFAVDNVLANAFNAAAVMRELCPSIRTSGLVMDFNREDFDLGPDSERNRIGTGAAMGSHLPPPMVVPENGRMVIFQYGTTLSNAEGPSSQLPFAQVSANIGNTRRQMREGDYFIIGINQRGQEDPAYSEPSFRDFHALFPRFLQKHLHRKAGVKPDDFEVFTRWIPETGVQVFGYRMRRDGEIAPANTVRRYKAGQEVVTCNSWQFTPDFMQAVYDANNLVLERVLPDRRSGMNLQVLRAA